MREKVLNVIGNNLETVIKEDLKNIVTNKKMEKEEELRDAKAYFRKRPGSICHPGH